MHTSGPLIGSSVQLEKITEKDLRELWELVYEKDHPEWKKWDIPCLPLMPMEYERFYDQMVNLLKQGFDRQYAIKVHSEMIGIIFYNWEQESSNSLEIGLAIYRPEYWSEEFEMDALKTWMDHLFETFSIPRIGLSTWSGNERMITVAKKLGLMIEGRIRKSRLYRSRYYDTVKLGILREEWELNKHR
ncbi:GNAT family N-acetyltransferase [Mesobacillus foraminis]|uniref:GNAT family N-acetyltransferase n=1 Tax=Mesobacillus foraminis TaxID=279826 RepID=UPI001BE80C14|nr:GNAT family protein [Mesobacillus foraminis]MBT2755414.1 GNAT family N-acetyltransferase [Mesobacillus foraminis]